MPGVVSARRSRPDWDEVWMDLAYSIARRSLCDLAKVGAVVVAQDNSVARASYNGPAPGLDITENCISWCPLAQSGQRGAEYYPLCIASHAEANAIARSDWSQTQGGTIYVSAAVCINCARQIASTRLARVVHCTRGPDNERRNPAQVEEYLRSAGLAITRWREEGKEEQEDDSKA